MAYFRGQVVPYTEVRLGLLTHALNYGTAVFGGLRAFWNEDEKELFVFRPLDHFRRFLDSARLLRMELATTPEALVAAACASCCASRARGPTATSGRSPSTATRRSACGCMA